MTKEVVERKATEMPSPSQVGKKISSHHSNATVYIGEVPKGAYGPNPAVFEPIFAEAYNYLQHPELVKLERRVRNDPKCTFDIFRWLTKFREACYQSYQSDLSEFNESVVKELRKLMPFIEFEPHVPLYHDKKRLAAEMDWRGTCLTAHGLQCLVVCGEGKRKYSEGGNPIPQAYLALQRMLALNPVRE